MAETKRPTVPAMEEILGEPIPVLDHGMVRVVDYMGDDAAIVQAARVSYGAGTETPSSDRGLIRYLMRHWHSTPFEMCEIKLHVKLPIFVARQWIRHRTANVNEVSARYSILDREFYVPAPEHLAAQSTDSKQGRGEVLTGEEAATALNVLRAEGVGAFGVYEALLNEGHHETEGRKGLARELARIVLPVSTFTQWYWKVDLHNLFHFLRLRADPHAQYEIRVYADAILGVVERWVPEAAAAFHEYRMGGFHLSASMVKALRSLYRDGDMAMPDSMSPREWREFMAMLDGGGGGS
jgi:thymidylate synthase (FAD)